VGLESLLTELLVAARLHRVNFKSVRVSVHKVVLSEHVRDGHEGSADAESHHKNNFSVRHFRVTEVRDVLCYVMSHLRCGGGCAVIVLHHAVVKLGRHSNNHVIVVGVEVTTFGHIETERRRVVVASEQVVGIVGQTRLHVTGLGQLGWPNTLVSVLGLMDGHVGWPDSVVNLALSVVPLLEVVRTVFLMTRVDLGENDHLLDQFLLSETLFNEQVVLLMHSTVTTLARAGEHLETSAKCGRVVRVPGDVAWEVVVPVVHTHRVDLLFVALDTVRSTNVVTEEPSFVLDSVAGEGVHGTACEKRRADRSEVSVD